MADAADDGDPDTVVEVPSHVEKLVSSQTMNI
jgi:hypothetical protein